MTQPHETFAASLAALELRVDEHIKHSTSDRALAEDALALLESRKCCEYFDLEVRLVCKIVANVLPYEDDPLLALRLLYASFPAGAKLRERRLHGRWLLTVGVCEYQMQRLGPSLMALAAALEVARELGSPTGEDSVLGNLAEIAASAGRYEEALHLLESSPLDTSKIAYPEATRAKGVNKGNAFLRLGRPDEALAEFAVALASVPARPNPRERTVVVKVAAMIAEILLQKKRPFDARSILSAGRTWADLNVLTQRRTLLRIEALIAIADGMFEEGVASLESCLTGEFEGSDRESELDVLYSLEAALRASGRHIGADETLTRIGDRLSESAVAFADALNAEAQLAQLISAEERLHEIQGFLAERRYSVVPRRRSHSDRVLETLVAKSAEAEIVDDRSQAHGLRVSHLSRLLCLATGESRSIASAVGTAALLHDIGKLGVPASVLAKSTPLSQSEQRLLDAHATFGAELLGRTSFKHKQMAVNVAMHHHTKFSGDLGQGGLSGDSIPMEARIVAVCDAFDSLVQGRPRLSAMSPNGALKEIYTRSGRDFDPLLVDLFIELVRRLMRDHVDLMAFLASSNGETEYFEARRLLVEATAKRTNTNLGD